MYFVITFDGAIAVCDEHGNVPKDAGKLLEAHLDSVMDEFYKIDAQDPDIELDLENLRVRFATLVEASDPDIAIVNASVLIRTAIHAAGGSTPDWPGHDNKAWSVRKVSLSVRPVDLVAV